MSKFMELQHMLKYLKRCFLLVISISCLWAMPAGACEHHKKAAAEQEKAAKMAIQTTKAQLAFDVEIASTPKALEHGLMGRKTLPENYAMLFWFGDDAKRAMWMKNTPLPLDMLFVDKQGEIVYIKHNATPYSTDMITSDAPVRAVIELPGGTAKAKNIQPGDHIEHPYFKS
jgi:uncharacterized membrane protein (UPF0127 family)